MSRLLQLATHGRPFAEAMTEHRAAARSLALGGIAAAVAAAAVPCIARPTLTLRAASSTAVLCKAGPHSCLCTRLAQAQGLRVQQGTKAA